MKNVPNSMTLNWSFHRSSVSSTSYLSLSTTTLYYFKSFSFFIFFNILKWVLISGEESPSSQFYFLKFSWHYVTLITPVEL